MKVHFFDRYFVAKRISIEKVFSVVKNGLLEKKVIHKSFQNPYSSLTRMLSSMKYFKKHQGQINHITGDIHWACLLLDSKKTVLTIHDVVGFHEYKDGLKRKLYMFFWFYLPLKKLKYITVISQKTKNELVDLYPKFEKKLRVINNPLTIANQDENRNIQEKKIKDFNLLIVGTRENKNIDRILEAVKNINCNVTILGKLNETSLEKIRLSKANVKNYDFVSDEELVQLYKEHDILCFASLYEGFGMPIIEAQACGCAVITSNLEPMLSVAGEGALFVNPLDVEDISNKICTVMGDHELRSCLVEKGYKNAANYAQEKIVQQYLDLYKEILNGK